MLTADLLEKFARTAQQMPHLDRGGQRVDAASSEQLSKYADELEARPEVQAVLQRVGWSAYEYVHTVAELLMTLPAFNPDDKGERSLGADATRANMQVVLQIRDDENLAPTFTSWKRANLDAHFPVLRSPRP